LHKELRAVKRGGRISSDISARGEVPSVSIEKATGGSSSRAQKKKGFSSCGESKKKELERIEVAKGKSKFSLKKAKTTFRCEKANWRYLPTRRQERRKKGGPSRRYSSGRRKEESGYPIYARRRLGRTPISRNRDVVLTQRYKKGKRWTALKKGRTCEESPVGRSGVW